MYAGNILEGLHVKFMNIKIIIPLVLIMGISVLAGCQSEASIKKDKLFTEKNQIQNIEKTGELSEEKLRKIAIEGFKKHLNVDVDTEGLFEYIQLLEPGSWHVSWSTFDERKLEDANKKLMTMKNSGDSEKEKENLQQAINDLAEDYNRAISYYAKIEQDGEIKEIGIKNGDISHEKLKGSEVKIKEKSLALNALEEFAGKEVDITNLKEEINMNEDNWRFYWENEKDWNLKEMRSIDYAVTIDRETKEVKSITYVHDVSKEGQSNRFPEFDIKEGRKIAYDFIKSRNYVEDIDQIKFLRYWNADPQIVLFNVDYIYGIDKKTGKTKVISISVNKRTKEVWAMGKTLESEEQLNSKQYERTNKPNPNALG